MGNFVPHHPGVRSSTQQNEDFGAERLRLWRGDCPHAISQYMQQVYDTDLNKLLIRTDPAKRV